MIGKLLPWLAAVDLPRPKPEAAAVALTAVRKVYMTGAGEFVALKGIDLQVDKGEFVAVVGKSGNGKSTLINMITGIDRPTSGDVWVAGTPMLPMDFCNVYDPAERPERAMELLKLVGVENQADKVPANLSGGQQQRVAIARCLSNDPPLLVADEPTGNLDSRTAEAVIELFRELTRGGKTILMVTHDEDLARRSSRIVTVSEGLIVPAALTGEGTL
ncbi:MAG: Phosphonate-transporting ATPase [Firmicutes bacterium]|nr:Phosphonate-transporting ATPase [Bacillota bacterium]